MNSIDPKRSLSKQITLSALLMVLTLLVGCGGSPSFDVDPSASCAAGDIRLNLNFEGASPSECRRTGAAGFSLEITPERDPPINNSPWYGFQITGRPDTEVEVVINYRHGGHRYAPKLFNGSVAESLGNPHRWSLLDSERIGVTEDRSSATLALRLPSGGSLVVAAQPLTMPDQVLTFSEGLAASGGAELSTLGRSAEGRPIPMLRSGMDQREVLLLVGRQHPPEVTGWDAYAAFAQTVWGDSPLAKRFRKRFAIVAVPMLNPDGIARGYWRLSTGGLDLNRDWGPFTQPETQLMANLLDSLDQDNHQIRLFLDFHSTWRNLFYTQSDANPTWPAGFTERWLNASRRRLAGALNDNTDAYPFTQEKSRRSTQANSKNYIYGRYGVPAVTYEVGDNTPLQANQTAARIFAEEAMALLLSSTEAPPHYSLIIRNATLIDGTGRLGFSGTVGIRGDRIAALSVGPGATADREIDATGLWVVPGFIDPHTHAYRDLASAERKRNLNYLTQGVTTVFVGSDGRGLNNRRQALDTLANQGIGTNMGFFAGHGSIREAVMGRENRAPTATELADMKDLLAGAMADGALGLSSGLYYVPGSYSETPELIALAEVAEAAGGVYDTHLRSESAVGLMDAVAEALNIGRASGVPVHISHIKALGSDAWGTSQQLISTIEAAREEGLAVSANQYPWEASGTRFSNALVPRRLMEGSRQKMRERLSDPAVLAEAGEEMLAALKRRGGPEAMLITGISSRHRGLTLGQAANAQGLEPLEAAIAEIINGDPAIASFVMSPDDIQELAVQPWVVTGSDGSEGHPRKFATYPKVYQHFVVDQSIMTLERFVRRSSGQVADTFGLCDRGYLAAGLAADVAVIDPDTFLPQADYQNPTALSTGVRYLLVNGELVIDNGRPSSKTAGRIIRKTQLGC